MDSIQRLAGLIRKADTDYKMIENGDKIAVGVSGGKDSLALIAALKNYQRYSDNNFDLCAVTIDMGFNKENTEKYKDIKNYMEDLNVPYYIEYTDIAQIIFDIRKEENPCSLCSKMRRGALNQKIIKLGYNKLALGHHADDLIETLLLSLFYEGRFSTFSPVSYMDKSKITLIRPMIYADEKLIISIAKNLPVYKNPCPADKHTQREYIKTLLKNIQNEIPFVKQRIHSAIINPQRNNLFDKNIKNETN